jgi:hypothetical protein
LKSKAEDAEMSSSLMWPFSIPNGSEQEDVVVPKMIKERKNLFSKLFLASVPTPPHSGSNREQKVQNLELFRIFWNFLGIFLEFL